MIRKMSLGLVIFLIICAALYLRLRKPKPSLGVAYASDRGLVLYNSSAQVHSAVGTVNYGEPLHIQQQFGDQIEVRTNSGVVGWTNSEYLISPALWDQEKDLDKQTASATLEARGHTRVLSNLHLEPGRDTARVRQLKKDVSIGLYERRAIPIPQTPAQAAAAQGESGTSDSGLADNGPKKEDWWLVRAHLDDGTTVSGWLIGRFLELDVPDALTNYASSSGTRIVAWFPLNPALDTNGQEIPQYLLVGTSGPEGQACDFTVMRVYTWAKMKAQYETAFVDSNVCGKLPVKIERMPAAQQATIAFTDPGDNSAQLFRMSQTIVRRIKTGDDVDSSKGKKR